MPFGMTGNTLARPNLADPQLQQIYNSLNSLMTTQLKYDDATKTAGPLQGTTVPGAPASVNPGAAFRAQQHSPRPTGA